LTYRPGTANCRKCSAGTTGTHGGPLPLEAGRAAFAEAHVADFLLVLGASLLINPAAELPRVTLARGGSLVIVNCGPTPLDAQSFLRFTELEQVFGDGFSALTPAPPD
jgi:NAD-dependent deacetylase